MYPRAGPGGQGASPAGSALRGARSSTSPDRLAAARARLVRFYSYYNPSKLVVVDEMVRDCRGAEEDLFEALVRMYGPEPPIDAGTTGEAARSRRRLTRFYSYHCPDRLPTVDTVLARYRGREEQLFAALVAKYGAEPPPPGAAPSAELARASSVSPPPPPRRSAGRSAHFSFAAPEEDRRWHSGREVDAQTRSRQLAVLRSLGAAAHDALRRRCYFRWLEHLWWVRNLGALSRTAMELRQGVQQEQQQNQRLSEHVGALMRQLGLDGTGRSPSAAPPAFLPPGQPPPQPQALWHYDPPRPQQQQWQHYALQQRAEEAGRCAPPGCYPPPAAVHRSPQLQQRGRSPSPRAEQPALRCAPHPYLQVPGTAPQHAAPQPQQWPPAARQHLPRQQPDDPDPRPPQGAGHFTYRPLHEQIEQQQQQQQRQQQHLSHDPASDTQPPPLRVYPRHSAHLTPAEQPAPKQPPAKQPPARAEAPPPQQGEGGGGRRVSLEVPLVQVDPPDEESTAPEHAQPQQRRASAADLQPAASRQSSCRRSSTAALAAPPQPAVARPESSAALQSALRQPSGPQGAPAAPPPPPRTPGGGAERGAVFDPAAAAAAAAVPYRVPPLGDVGGPRARRVEEHHHWYGDSPAPATATPPAEPEPAPRQRRRRSRSRPRRRLRRREREALASTVADMVLAAAARSAAVPPPGWLPAPPPPPAVHGPPWPPPGRAARERGGSGWAGDFLGLDDEPDADSLLDELLPPRSSYS